MNNGFGSDWVMQASRDEAKDRLREKAQNEATCFALNDMLKDVQAEVRRLREENERLRERAKTIGELEQLAARSNNNLLVENDRLREENERLRKGMEEHKADAERWQFFRSAGNDVTLRMHNSRFDFRDEAIDAARGVK